MNNHVVADIKLELVKLSQREEIANIISEHAKNFTVDYLDREYQKIVSAKEKDYPTYRSEYRVIKTLDRQRKLIIYHLVKNSKNFPRNEALLHEMIGISRIIKPLLESIGEIFSLEEEISNVANDFDSTLLL